MKRALIVVTNHGQFDKIERATGLWFAEAVHFHEQMARHGIAVDYVSPQGGYVPVDPGSLAPTAMDKVCWRYWSDPVFREKALADSLAPDEVDPADYDVIYFAGGHGALWDFPGSTALSAIAEAIWAKGGVVSAVCHGVVGLLGMTNPDGTPFVKEKHLTGYSDVEEKEGGDLTDAVPYSDQDALEADGAGYTCGKPFGTHVVTDGNLVTGQNPRSAAAVGKKVAQILGA